MNCLSIHTGLGICPPTIRLTPTRQDGSLGCNLGAPPPLSAVQKAESFARFPGACHSHAWWCYSGAELAGRLKPLGPPRMNRTREGVRQTRTSESRLPQPIYRSCESYRHHLIPSWLTPLHLQPPYLGSFRSSGVSERKGSGVC